MPLPAKFSLLHSELNDFLFAQIGEEESGLPLSVLSALTRLGIDPWVEGARLSHLPRDVAARALVPTIEKFPQDERGSSEALALSQRLVALLPERSAVRATDGVVSDNRRPVRLPVVGLVCAVVLAIVFGMAALGLLP